MRKSLSGFPYPWIVANLNAGRRLLSFHFFHRLEILFLKNLAVAHLRYLSTKLPSKLHLIRLVACDLHTLSKVVCFQAHVRLLVAKVWSFWSETLVGKSRSLPQRCELSYSSLKEWNIGHLPGEKHSSNQIWLEASKRTQTWSRWWQELFSLSLMD